MAIPAQAGCSGKSARHSSQRPFEAEGRRLVVFSEGSQTQPAKKRAGRGTQRPFAPFAIGVPDKIPQCVAIRGFPGGIAEHDIECDPFARRFEAASRVLVGPRQEPMDPFCRFGTESSCWSTGKQLDRPFGPALPHRQFGLQQVAYRGQIAGQRLRGELVEQFGCAVRVSGVEKQTDSLQHQVLSNRSLCASRQRQVRVCGLCVAALGEKRQRSLLRRDVGSGTHRGSLASRKGHSGNRDDEYCSHEFVRPVGADASRDDDHTENAEAGFAA